MSFNSTLQTESRPKRARQRKRSLRATILGTGSALPPQVIDNEYFAAELGLDTSAAWIAEKTGILQRRQAAADVTASQLAAEAAQTALADAGVTAEEIELVIVATSSPDYTMPATACLVQRQIGASRAMAFDVVNACAGFVYAFDAAARYLNTGVRSALVIGVDLGSRLVSKQDRGTCVFFGDGAAAVVLSASGSGRMLTSTLHASGEREALHVPVGGTMVMDGRAIWNFATAVLPSTVRKLCDDAKVSVGEIKLLVPHQANLNIIQHAAAELGLPMDRVAVNLDRYGNTLAASIPLALDEALCAGRVARGDLVALVGFGAGLAWGGQLLRL